MEDVNKVINDYLTKVQFYQQNISFLSVDENEDLSLKLRCLEYMLAQICLLDHGYDPVNY